MSDSDFRLHRGLILLKLEAQYPFPTAEAALSQGIGPFYAGDQKRMTRDLEYLREKGYLTIEEQRVGSQNLRSFKITAEGVDLVQGSTTDAGIDIARGS